MFAEGDAHRPDSESGLVVVDHTDLDVPILVEEIPTSGRDYDVHYADRGTVLVDGHSYDGLYLVSVDGVGGSAAAVERLGQWRLFNLGQGPQITQIAQRTVNLTPTALATCLSESGFGLCNIEFAGVPRDIGFPLAVTTAGAQASYIANIPKSIRGSCQPCDS